MRLLAGMGFALVIAAERPLLDGRSDEEIRDGYRSLCPGATVEVSLIENMLEMGFQQGVRHGNQRRRSLAPGFADVAPELLLEEAVHLGRCGPDALR